MAATTEAKSTAAGLDAASFLAPEDIPIKLRCAICNKLAINAFRLPCCDQSICENCHSRLPEQCPVCEHSPLSAEDCKPNKSLRTTIKVFLRTEEKKREQAKEKLRHNVPPPAPAAIAEPEKRDPAGPDASAEVIFSTNTASREDGATSPEIVVAAITEVGREAPETMVTNLQDDNHTSHWTHRHDAGDSAGHQQSPNPTEVEERSKDGLSTNDDTTKEVIEVVKTGKPNGFLIEEQNSPLNMAMGQAQHLVESSGFNQMAGYSQGAFGTSGIQPGFSNMGWNMHDGFNAMYQDMQSPMPTGQWDMMPNMMGIPSMNGAPMAMSQGMYNGIGGQGMGMNGPGGMNGINMGMGMGMEMAYDAGHSGYNGWNGQSSWNAGQDMFHPNAGGGGPARGRMGGGFGSNSSSGFHHQHPAATGFNVQSSNPNYNPMPYGQHIRPNHDFQSGFNGGPGRGFFRGGPRRGGPGPGHLLGGRGGGSFNHAFPRNGEPFHHQLPSRPPPNRAESRQHNSTLPDLAETLGLSQVTDAKPLAGAGSESGSNEPKIIGATTENTIEISGTRPGANSESTDDAVVVDGLGGDVATDTSVIRNQPQNGYPRSGEAAARSRVDDTPNWGETNSGDSRRGVVDLVQSIPHWSPKVINAPLGPAALTQGDHSYSGFSGRGRGSIERGELRGSTIHGGRGTSSMGSNGFGITPPSGPAADRTKKSELPKVAPVELKGQGVEGAPKAPKALREGLSNSGIRGRGFPSGGRNGLTTAGGQTSTGRLRSRSPKRGRSRSRPPSSFRDGRDARRQRSRSRSRDKDEQSQRRDQQRRRSRGRDRPQVDQHPSHTKGVRSRRASIDRSRSSSRSSTKNDAHQAQPGKETRSSRRSRKSRRSRRERSKERRRRRRSRARSRSPLAETTRNGREPRDIGPSSDRRGSRDRMGLNREDLERSRRDAPIARDHSDYARHQAQRGNRGEDVNRISLKTGDTRPNARSPSDANLHTREREERNRERTLREQQRRDTFDREQGRNSRDRKREREDDGGGPGDVGAGYARDHNEDDLEGRSKRKRAKHRGQRGTVDGAAAGANVSRRVNYKYEDDESVEARARRIEKEREATRWG